MGSSIYWAAASPRKRGDHDMRHSQRCTELYQEWRGQCHLPLCLTLPAVIVYVASSGGGQEAGTHRAPIMTRESLSYRCPPLCFTVWPPVLAPPSVLPNCDRYVNKEIPAGCSDLCIARQDRSPLSSFPHSRQAAIPGPQVLPEFALNVAAHLCILL
jgi:hypothetical protein